MLCVFEAYEIKDTPEHDRQTQAAEFGLLSELSQQETVPYEPRVRLGRSPTQNDDIRLSDIYEVKSCTRLNRQVISV